MRELQNIACDFEFDFLREIYSNDSHYVNLYCFRNSLADCFVDLPYDFLLQ